MLRWPVRESLLAYETLLKEDALRQYRFDLVLHRLTVGPCLIDADHAAPPFPEFPEILS